MATNKFKKVLPGNERREALNLFKPTKQKSAILVGSLFALVTPWLQPAVTLIISLKKTAV